MAPTKKTGSTAATTKKSSGSQLSYKDMIKGSIIALKERNGSSRQALKKYIQGNFNPTLTGAQFDAAFNKAIKTGVVGGDFTQPKGPSGPVKLAKKEPAEKKASKPAAKTGEGKETKKAAPKKASSTTKTAASKTKTTTAKKPAAKSTTASAGAAKPKKAAAATGTKKANTGTKRKTPSSAPAVVDQPSVLSKTKSGRVSKGKAPTPGSTSAKRSAAGKKGAAKSPATKKATPAKAEA